MFGFENRENALGYREGFNIHEIECEEFFRTLKIQLAGAISEMGGLSVDPGALEFDKLSARKGFASLKNGELTEKISFMIDVKGDGFPKSYYVELTAFDICIESMSSCGQGIIKSFNKAPLLRTLRDFLTFKFDGKYLFRFQKYQIWLRNKKIADAEQEFKTKQMYAQQDYIDVIF